MESIWFYSKDWQKLLKKNIGGVDFYYPVEKTDLSNGDSSWWNYYKAFINWYIITLQLQAPLYDEKRNKEVKIEVDNVLSNIKINSNNLWKTNNNFSTNIPKIDIKDLTGSIADTWKYKIYLWNNLYEYININLNELLEYNGKWKTLDEIYDVQLKDVDSSEKSKIKFKWLDGYITCSDKISAYSCYNYYGNYNNYWYTNTDEYWNAIEIKSCQINIYFPLDKELNRQNYISVEIKSETAKLKDNINKTINFLSKNLDVQWINKEVKIPNLISNQIKLNFKDLTKQSSTYKNFLKLLVRYWAIENTEKFKGEQAITWWEYVDIYTKWIYNFDTKTDKCKNNDYNCKRKNYNVLVNWKSISLDVIFKSMWIDYNEYVDRASITDFEKLFKYKLAGINIWELNEENINLFEIMPDEELYINEKKKINDLNNSIYWAKKILIQDFYSNYTTFFNTNKENRFYVADKQLKQVDKFKADKKSLTYKSNNIFNLQIELEKLTKNTDCLNKKTYNEFSKCGILLKEEINKIQNKYEKSSESTNFNSNYYIVLTKAEALENIFTQVDFWLYDKELAKKKDTQIEEYSNLK